MPLQNLNGITPEEVSGKLHVGQNDTPGLGTLGMQELLDAQPNLIRAKFNAAVAALNSWIGNILAKDNTTPYTPTADYHPATKKYADDIAHASGAVTPEDITNWNGKADQTYVDEELPKKADITYVDSQLSNKANAADTYTKTQTDGKLADKANLSGATFSGTVNAPSLQVLAARYPLLNLLEAGVTVATIIMDGVGKTLYLRALSGGNSTGVGILGDTYKAFFPESDNSLDLGTAVSRWKDVYARNAVINTSDARLKTDIIPLDDGVMIAFLRALNPVQYKFVDGTSGRPHYGLIAQEVERVMRDCGIEDFAGLIKSPVLDDDGNDTGDVVYGLRYSEFTALLIKVAQAHEDRIVNIEARLAAAGL